MAGLAQFLMGETEIVGAADQVHPGFQVRQPMSSMAALACEGGKALSKRPVETLDKSRIPDRSASRSFQQIIRLRFVSPGQPPCHFDEVVFFHAFDNCDDT